MRPCITALGLLPVGQGTFEGGTGKHSIHLQLTGMGQDRAKAAAEKILIYSPGLVLATGFAGSLRDDIVPGDLVLDKARSDSHWAEKMADAAERLKISCHQGAFYSSENIVAKSLEKREIGMKSGAIAVEMESQGIFETLKPKRIPLLFIRSVSDGCSQNLPQLAGLLDAGGDIRFSGLFKIFTRPGQWGDFIRLAAGSKKAEASLARTLKEFLNHA